MRRVQEEERVGNVNGEGGAAKIAQSRIPRSPGLQGEALRAEKRGKRVTREDE